MATYTEQLLKIFEVSLKENCPESLKTDLTSNFLAAITDRKYDVQDQALIEAVLKDDRDSLAESFSAALQLRLETETSEFLNSEEGKQEIINLFLKSLEHTIDLYYNSVISKQFSST